MLAESAACDGTRSATVACARNEGSSGSDAMNLPEGLYDLLLTEGLAARLESGHADIHALSGVRLI